MGQTPITHTDAAAALPRGETITVLAAVPETEFNPPRAAFTWNEPVHRERFRFRTTAATGSTVRGELWVFLGSVIIATIPFTIRVDEVPSTIADPDPTAASVYRRIFACYSHDDRDVVDRIVEANSLGARLLIDHRDLTVGLDWKNQVSRLIDDADVFQLFWSHNSIRSEFVLHELDYALSLRRGQGFIRPVYWEEPLPRSDDNTLPPPELADVHFGLLRPAPVDGDDDRLPATPDAHAAPASHAAAGHPMLSPQSAGPPGRTGAEPAHRRRFGSPLPGVVGLLAMTATAVSVITLSSPELDDMASPTSQLTSTASTDAVDPTGSSAPVDG